MIGAKVGGYRITRMIGQGGMGAVYAGEHELIGRAAAIKVLLPEFTQNADIVQRFFNEAKATTAIGHPSIVEIFDFGWNPDGSAFIVMEMLRGESLAARMKTSRPSWGQSLSLVRQLVGALVAAHARGIVHRDLKPDNVFLSPDPEVPGGERIKLLDFGIAKLAGDANTTSKTRTGSVMGTPTYMAPEQCRGVAVDHRADLYAVGCILYELVTGRPPFIGEGVGDVLAAHIHVPPPPTAAFVQGVPQALEDLLQRLLAKQPDQRVPSAEELVRVIDAVGPQLTGSYVRPPTLPHGVSAAPTTLSGASHARSIPATTEPARGSKTWLWATLAITATAIAAVAVVVTRREDAPAKAVAAVATDVVAPKPVVADVAPTTQPAPIDAAVVEATMVDLALDSVPTGADISINGVSVGTAPYRGILPRGTSDVRVVLRLSGYKDRTITLRPEAAITRTETLDVRGGKATKPAPGQTRNQSFNPF